LKAQFFSCECNDQSLLDLIRLGLDACGDLELQQRLDLPFLIELGAVYINSTRAVGNPLCKTGDIVRVHPDPKRYSKYALNSRALVIDETDDFLLVLKPAGVPVHAALDNSKENLLHWLEQDLDLKLWNTHRLDVGTHGLLFFGKTKTWTSRFQKALAGHNVKKTYRAGVQGVLALTPLPRTETHWMIDSLRQPKEVSAFEVSNSKKCELGILRIENIQSGTQESVNQQILTLNLITGRTHQIRAQLSFLGAPILGDSLYGSKQKFMAHEWTTPAQDSWALACTEVSYLGQTWSLNSQQSKLAIG
jgi:23S rRNA pseudouridine1911/1915/1917 synthase